MTTIFTVQIYSDTFKAVLEKLPDGSRKRYRAHLMRSFTPEGSGELLEEHLLLEKFDSANEAKIAMFASMAGHLAARE